MLIKKFKDEVLYKITGECCNLINKDFLGKDNISCTNTSTFKRDGGYFLYISAIYVKDIDIALNAKNIRQRLNKLNKII